MARVCRATAVDDADGCPSAVCRGAVFVATSAARVTTLAVVELATRPVDGVGCGADFVSGESLAVFARRVDVTLDGFGFASVDVALFGSPLDRAT